MTGGLKPFSAVGKISAFSADLVSCDIGHRWPLLGRRSHSGRIKIVWFAWVGSIGFTTLAFHLLQHQHWSQSAF